MKNFRLTLFFLAALTAAGTAQAQSSRLYFAGYLGLNSFTESEFTLMEALLKMDGFILLGLSNVL